MIPRRAGSNCSNSRVVVRARRSARLLTYVESGGATQLDTVAVAYEARSPYVRISRPPGGGQSTLTDRLITLTLDCGSFDGDTILPVRPRCAACCCVDPFTLLAS